MNGNSRIPILVFLEIANSFAGTNVIQVILPVRVITLVLKYSDRNPLFFLLLFIQQTWCVISHLKPHIISIALNVSQSLNWTLEIWVVLASRIGWSWFSGNLEEGWQLGGSFTKYLEYHTKGLWKNTQVSIDNLPQLHLGRLSLLTSCISHKPFVVVSNYYVIDMIPDAKIQEATP